MKKPTFLSHYKIKYQLLFIYIFLIFLPMSILGIYFISKTKSELLLNYETQLEMKKNSVNLLFLDITKNNYEILNSLFNNNKLLQLLQSELEYADLSQIILEFDITDYYLDNTSISSITFYTNNKNLNSLGNFRLIDSSIEEEEWFNKAKNQMSAFYIVSPQEKNHTETLELTFLQKIALPITDDFAILEIKTSSNFLKSRLKDNAHNIYLKLGDDYFYSDTQGDELLLELLHSNNVFLGIDKISNTDIMYANYNFTPYLSKDVINVVIIDKYGLLQTNKIINSTILTIFIVFALTFILIIIFIITFSRRINILKFEVESAINGNYLLTESLEGEDELSVLFNDLKKVFLNAKKVEEDMLQGKIKEQKLINAQHKIELKMLQSQINPHFLYNTLETIRMNALSFGDKKTATSIKLLGKSMRYVLENTIYNTTTLAKELEYVKTYIDIQNIRFNNNISYTLKCDPIISTKDIQFLPLLLQPLVENSILHGFINIDFVGKILITISTTEESLIFNVSDNGIGLSENNIKKLNLLMLGKENLNKSIGLQNINKRLKVYYNSKGLTFSNINNKFNVNFEIPLQQTNSKFLNIEEH